MMKYLRSRLGRLSRRSALLGVLALAVVGGLYLAVSAAQAPQAQTRAPHAGQAAPVLAAEAVVKPMPVEIAAVGHVQTIASVAVRARVDGEIAAVPVADGQAVKAGDVLFTLDDRQARAQLDQARAALARDRAQLDYARKQVARYGPLAARDYSPREQFDLAQSNAGALAGTVKADEAAVAGAETQLSYTVIRAPIDGRIGTIAFKTGNSVQAAAATPLATINQIRPVYVALAIAQRDLAEVRRAMARGPVPVAATVAGDAGGPIHGTLAFIENQVDQASGTISLKAAFDNADERLWPGQFVDATLSLRIEPKAVTVPTVAVQDGQDGAYVFVVRPDSTVEQRPVAVGWSAGAETVIAKGLAGGEKVVTTGQLRLTNGAAVQVRSPGDRPATAELPS
ncbi:MAG: efflux RND transporter periplasmic adaptor subunit [Rhodospirillales bacterium]